MGVFFYWGENMNDIETYKTRKKGEYTPADVLKKAADAISKEGAKRMVVVIQSEDDTIHRFNTELDTVELSGLLEAAKIFEFVD